MIDVKNREMNPSVVRFRLANAGWSTFKIIVNYQEQDSRCWKIIIGTGVENIDCVYKINHPNNKGELEEVFILTDNQQYLSEIIIPANTEELIKVLQEKFPTHVFANPLKQREDARDKEKEESK
jgi:hypothetical protein